MVPVSQSRFKDFSHGLDSTEGCQITNHGIPEIFTKAKQLFEIAEIDFGDPVAWTTHQLLYHPVQLATDRARLQSNLVDVPYNGEQIAIPQFTLFMKR